MTALPPRSPLEPTLVDHPLPKAGLEATVVDAPGADENPNAIGRALTVSNPPSSERLVPPPSVRPMIPDVDIENHLDPTAPKRPRYDIGNLLGTGSSSHVYAGLDRTFDREVAIKFLESGLAQDARRLTRFVREARLTAHLDHPNIVPVYDLETTSTGDLYLTMRRINGVSLGDAIRSAAEGKLPAELGDLNRRVNIMLKVCDALTCAHVRGIAHLDVKPDNIMLGAFGEVVLVDWGLARRVDEVPRVRQNISGTPAYMSPEQSTGHPGDALADVYCLGATLFHVLTLRHPTWASSESEFWTKKRAGIIDLPTDEERARIPKQLLAIALKALTCDRADRYPSVKALSDDLHLYQSGLTVSVYRESRLERVRRWHRTHARPLWTGVIATVVVIASTLYVYGERLKEVVAWGSPIYYQSFSDDGWRADFNDVGEGARWIRQDDRLVSMGSESNYLFLKQRFYGPVAVEVEGEMLPGCRPCDLSLAWSMTDPASNPQWQAQGAYHLQTGMNVNTCAAITQRINGQEIFLARNETRLVSGVRYHLRFEIDDDRLSVDLDGRRICEARTSFPCAAGYIGLYAYYPGKAFDNFTVYAKDVPQRVSPHAIGDAFFRRGQPLKAAEQYGLVADSFSGTILGDQALYKQGLCLAQLNKRNEALAAWSSLRDQTLIDLAECTRIEWANADGDVSKAVASFSALYRADPAIRPRLHQVFVTSMGIILQRAQYANIEQWLTLTTGQLPNQPIIDAAAAKALNFLGRWESVLERYPHIQRQAAWAFMALERPAEVLRRYTHGQNFMESQALFDLGRFDEKIHDPRKILHLKGQHEQALSCPVDPPGSGHAYDLIWLGRASEVLAESQPGSREYNLALIHLGRPEEVNGGDFWYTAQLRLRHYDVLLGLADQYQDDNAKLGHFARWLQALERHDETVARVELAAATSAICNLNVYADRPWFVRLIAVEFVHAHGDAKAFAVAMEALVKRGPDWNKQRPWHAARYLLGEIDDATYLAQPACGHAPAALLVLRGMRAELAGDRITAGTYYRSYLALPLHQRAWDLVEGDPITDQFVAWRLAEVGG